MTVIERAAKAANLAFWGSEPFLSWERQNPEYKKQWITAIEAALASLPPTFVIGLLSKKYDLPELVDVIKLPPPLPDIGMGFDDVDDLPNPIMVGGEG